MTVAMSTGKNKETKKIKRKTSTNKFSVEKKSSI